VGMSLWISSIENEEPFDAVLINLRMPHVPGMELANRMKTRPGALARAIMLLPHSFRSGDVDRCDEIGMGGCIAKPVDEARLTRILDMLFCDDPESEGSDVLDEVEDAARILLAEDSPENRFLVRSYLKDARYVIEWVADGKDAVSVFQNGAFDLVLMDMQLPSCDGYAAASAIRRWERMQGRAPTPMLALTSDTTEADRDRALESGCDEHLAKPILKRPLQNVVARLAARRNSEEPQPCEDSLREAISAIRPQYLDSRRNDLAALVVARTNEDFETIRRLGYNMKGTGTGFGFPDISKVGAVIERAARELDLATVTGAIERLSAILDRASAPRS